MKYYLVTWGEPHPETGELIRRERRYEVFEAEQAIDSAWALGEAGAFMPRLTPMVEKRPSPVPLPAPPDRSVVFG